MDAARVSSLSRIAPRLARAALEAVLIILLALFMARIAWLAVAPAGAVSTVTDAMTASLPQAGRAARAEADPVLLQRVNPFAPVDRAPLEAVAEDAPETALDLKLAGTRAATETDLSTATIVTPDNRQGVFRVGDEILKGVRIRRILSGRVILERDGQLESLIQGEEAPGTLSVIGGEAPRQVVDGAEVVEPLRVRLASPERLLEAVRIVPERDDSGLRGYRVTPGRDRSVLDTSGLAEGDVIVRVDGESVVDLDAEELAGRIGRAGGFSLTVQRGGETLQIEYEFEGE